MTTMSSSIAFYEQLLAAGDDRERARIIAEGFERLEDRYPELRDLATSTELGETRHVLQGQIRDTGSRLENHINDVETRLESRINDVETRLEGRINDVETRLGGRINDVETELGGRINGVETRLGKLEVEIGKLRSEVMAAMEAGFMRQQGTLLRWMSGLFLGQLAMVLAVVIALVQLLG